MNNVNQTHSGSGDNIGGDKNIGLKEKPKWLKDILSGVMIIIIGAFVVGVLHFYKVFGF